jgi:hypothetical protein
MTAQERFNATYISSTEIMRDLGISRTALSAARRSGRLKDPIILMNGLAVFYEREQVAEHVKLWKKTIEARRNV